LKTADGFEVSFQTPVAACKSLGRALQREADTNAQEDHSGAVPAGSGSAGLH
jgi:hypothetical protein